MMGDVLVDALEARWAHARALLAKQCLMKLELSCCAVRDQNFFRVLKRSDNNALISDWERDYYRHFADILPTMPKVPQSV
eukprot:1308412-Amphidinium_carterae.1